MPVMSMFAKKTLIRVAALLAIAREITVLLWRDPMAGDVSAALFTVRIIRMSTASIRHILLMLARRDLLRVMGFVAGWVGRGVTGRVSCLVIKMTVMRLSSVRPVHSVV